MKDLKEKIKKNNMKKLVLSAVFGVFCYCTNNAMKKQIEIDDVLITMLKGQEKINKAKKNIETYNKKIYFEINEEGKVKKGKVLDFITSHFTEEEQKEKEFPDDINKIAQYFHLEGKKEDYECSAANLTEIFWEKVETIKEEDKINIEGEATVKTKKYFQAIIEAEKSTSKIFQEYYAVKKEKNKKAQYEEILKEIMKDCCGNEKKDYDTVKNFLLKLGKLYDDEKISAEDKEAIITTIKKRITLSNDTAKEKEDFIYFLKQKIREEKKE